MTLSVSGPETNSLLVVSLTLDYLVSLNRPINGVRMPR
jgi:hypothetical protein